MKILRLAAVAAVVSALFTVFATSTALAYDFPSTNDANRANNYPHVDLVSQGIDEVTLSFVNDTNSLSYFEYRIDGEVVTSGTLHPVVAGEYIYPGVSVDSRNIATPVVVERTFSAESTVEVRLALGGERDWDFDWVTFEPLPPTNDCVFIDTPRSIQLAADCTTTATIYVPDGATLDGQGHTITAVDPDGGKFVGAVLQNDGSSMNITRITVLGDLNATGCGANADRLAGVRFANAGGSITRSSILNINKTSSGCQEGYGIEVRNPESDGAGTVYVQIANNRVENYQKSGVVVSGDIILTMFNNTIGAGYDQSALASNSVDIGDGAGGWVSNNTIYGNQWLGTSYWVATAMVVYGAENLQITNNTIRGNSDVGILIQDSSNIILRGNSIADQGNDANICHTYGDTCYTFDIGVSSYYSSGVHLLLNKISGFDVSYESDVTPQRGNGNQDRTGRSGRPGR